MIAPHKNGRKKPRTEDGGKLRSYRRQWKVNGFLPGFKIPGDLLFSIRVLC